MNTCNSCLYWTRSEDTKYSKDLGICSMLSGMEIPEGKELMGEKYPLEVYPDTEKTGIESYPLCVHDGKGFQYETKDWFGCIHHKNR